MQSKLPFCAPTTAVLLATTGCISITDPNHAGGHTGCTTWYNSIWQNKVNLTLDHSDSRSCPVTLQSGQYGSTGGLVYDNNAVYGQGLPNTNYLTVQAFDYTVGSNHDCQFPLGSPNTQYFTWVLIPPQNTQYRWQAQSYPSFYAGDNPDSACFNVDLWDNYDDARAVVTIYYGTQV